MTAGQSAITCVSVCFDSVVERNICVFLWAIRLFGEGRLLSRRLPSPSTCKVCSLDVTLLPQAEASAVARDHGRLAWAHKVIRTERRDPLSAFL